MLNPAVERYKNVRATTSSPGELLLALYDGLFRFLRGAELCLQSGEVTRARELLSKAFAVVSELCIALDHSLAPELCGNLERIYSFCMDRITMASRKADAALVAEVIRALTPLKQAWEVAVPESHMERSAAARSGGR